MAHTMRFEDKARILEAHASPEALRRAVRRATAKLPGMVPWARGPFPPLPEAVRALREACGPAVAWQWLVAVKSELKDGKDPGVPDAR